MVQKPYYFLYIHIIVMVAEIKFLHSNPVMSATINVAVDIAVFAGIVERTVLEPLPRVHVLSAYQKYRPELVEGLSKSE